MKKFSTFYENATSNDKSLVGVYLFSEQDSFSVLSEHDQGVDVYNHLTESVETRDRYDVVCSLNESGYRTYWSDTTFGNPRATYKDRKKLDKSIENDPFYSKTDRDRGEVDIKGGPRRLGRLVGAAGGAALGAALGGPAGAVGGAYIGNRIGRTVGQERAIKTALANKTKEINSKGPEHANAIIAVHRAKYDLNKAETRFLDTNHKNINAMHRTAFDNHIKQSGISGTKEHNQVSKMIEDNPHLAPIKTKQYAAVDHANDVIDNHIEKEMAKTPEHAALKKAHADLKKFQSEPVNESAETAAALEKASYV